MARKHNSPVEGTMRKVEGKSQPAADPGGDALKGAKRKYEAPMVMPLGELARGSGAWCTSGSAAGAPGDLCVDGVAAGWDCSYGSGASGDCINGPSAGTGCITGAGR